MRSEIGVTPYAKYYIPYLDGVELKHCRMADEELGCAEVFVLDEKGHRTLETRMVFGKIDLRPLAGLDPCNNPADAESIDRRQREFEAEVAALGLAELPESDLASPLHEPADWKCPNCGYGSWACRRCGHWGT